MAASLLKVPKKKEFRSRHLSCTGLLVFLNMDIDRIVGIGTYSIEIWKWKTYYSQLSLNATELWILGGEKGER